jgi:hypothetical protein
MIKRAAQRWVALSLLSMVCVSSCSFALVGAILCHTAVQAAERGDVADAKAKLRWGKIVAACGMLLGIVAASGLAALYAHR